MIMQNNTQTTTELDPYLKNSISGAAKVAGISAVLSIAGAVVAAIASFSNPAKTTASKEGFSNNIPFNFEGTSLISIIISLLLNGILFYHLFRFSKIAGRAAEHGQSNILASGVNNLAAYFKIFAILFILSAAFILMGSVAWIAGKAFS